jgi:cell division protein FtsN
MKRILFFIIVVFAFTACKTTRKQPQSQYTTDPTAQPKVFSVPGTETPTATQTVATPGETPISTKKEQVTFTQQEDRTGNETNTFFVILGSFSQLDNAKNYRETLLDEGFTPIILHSETGYYRVCVNSYKNENEARTRVRELRQAFPKYSDVWLLIKE